MNEDRRRRLEEAGWKFGDAAEFLNLSPEEVAFVEMKVALSEGLKAFRSKTKLTQEGLANRPTLLSVEREVVVLDVDFTDPVLSL